MVGNDNSAFQRKYALFVPFGGTNAAFLRKMVGEGFEAADSHYGPASLTWTNISSGGHFVQWNISVKLFWNRAIGLGGDIL